MSRGLFKKMLAEAKEKKFSYIGTGNPEAKILIIAKEAAISKSTEEVWEDFHKNAEYWDRDKDKNLEEIIKRGEYSPIYPYKGQLLIKDDKKGNWGTSVTWMNYQKLCNLIFGKVDDEINFHKYIFTTEANSSPSLQTKNADISSINNRKEFIKESDFFQNFPVVIIDGVRYFRSTKEINEIEDVFQVKYQNMIEVAKKQPIWIHYNESGKNPKLVLNTYQMSMTVSNERLEKMAEIIREFLKNQI